MKTPRLTAGRAALRSSISLLALLAAGATAAFGQAQPQAQPAWAGYGACLAEAKTAAQTDACDGRYLRAPAGQPANPAAPAPQPSFFDSVVAAPVAPVVADAVSASRTTQSAAPRKAGFLSTALKVALTVAGQAGTARALGTLTSRAAGGSMVSIPSLVGGTGVKSGATLGAIKGATPSLLGGAQAGANPLASMLQGGGQAANPLASLLQASGQAGANPILSLLQGGGQAANPLASLLQASGQAGANPILSLLQGGGQAANPLASLLQGGGAGANPLLGLLQGSGQAGANPLAGLLQGGAQSQMNGLPNQLFGGVQAQGQRAMQTTYAVPSTGAAAPAMIQRFQPILPAGGRNLLDAQTANSDALGFTLRSALSRLSPAGDNELDRVLASSAPSGSGLALPALPGAASGSEGCAAATERTAKLDQLRATLAEVDSVRNELLSARRDSQPAARAPAPAAPGADLYAQAGNLIPGGDAAPAAGAPGDAAALDPAAAAALRNIDANRAALKSRIAAVEAELAQLVACAKGGSGIR
jgi:hypothetical protein